MALRPGNGSSLDEAVEAQVTVQMLRLTLDVLGGVQALLQEKLSVSVRETRTRLVSEEDERQAVRSRAPPSRRKLRAMAKARRVLAAKRAEKKRAHPSPSEPLP